MQPGKKNLPPHEGDVGISYGVGVGGSGDLIFISMTNRGAMPLRWRQAGLELQDGSKRVAMVGSGAYVLPGYELPATVAQRDSHQTVITVAKVTSWGFDLHRSITAQVRLGTGEVFKSSPTTLLDS